MYSSITEIPSTQNNKLMKIGGAVAVFIIFVIILYFSFSKSTEEPTSTTTYTSTPSNPPITITRSRKLELFSKCNFTNMNSEESTIYAKTIGPITRIEKPIQDNIIEPIKLGDMCIKSIKNVGYNVILYSNPDFTGDTITILNGENKECLEKTMRSVIIDKMDMDIGTIQMTSSRTPILK